MYTRMIKQLRDRTRHTTPIERISVEIPGDDERGRLIESAASALIVDQISGTRSAAQIISPQPNFVVITTTVTIFGAIEAGRGRMTGEQM